MKTKLHTMILLLLSILLLPSIAKANTEKNEKTDSALSINPNENCADEIVFGETIRGFTLVDADTNTDIYKMKEGGVIDIDTFGNRKLNIRVNQLDEVAISVDFVLTGPINRTWTENVTPYALFGDINGNYNGVKLPLGNYHLEATAYLSEYRINGTGINFSVGTDTNAITSFNLIAAESDLNFDDRKEYYINDGQVFDQNSYPFSVAGNPVEISINANTNSYATGSVHFELSGPVSYTRVENVAPFTLFGDFEGDYYGQILPVGNYTLTATPYGGKNSKGKIGKALTIDFTMVKSSDISLNNFATIVDAHKLEGDDGFLIENIYSQELSVIDKSKLPSQISIKMQKKNTSDAIRSVYLSLDGPISYSRTENIEPFTLFGDINGVLYGRNLPVGSYELTAIPYTGPNRSESTGQTTIYRFKIVDSIDTTAKTYIPDDNFEKELIALGYDDVLDNYVLTSNITSVVYLDLILRNIRDLTGIEAFVSLTHLDASQNLLTEIDVSQNTNLEFLNVSGTFVSNDNSNLLEELDLSKNTALKTLFCTSNNLTSLDLSKNPALEKLSCGDNTLTSLNFSNNTQLVDLSCFGNNLTSLNLSNNLMLEELDFSSNYDLVSLDLSNNTQLIALNCANNNLKSLDLSNNLMLKQLQGGFNNLVSLDLSNNIALEHVSIGYTLNNNLLQNVNLKNGKNDILNYLDLRSNNSLNCVQVDDVEFAKAQQNWFVDNKNVYAESCGTIANKDASVKILLYPNPAIANSTVAVQNKDYSLNKILVLDSYGKLVMKWSGFHETFEQNINLSGLPSGLYFVQIYTGNERITKKLVVQ